MGDLSGVVFDTARTTTAPALIAWSERREAARLAREDQRRAQAAHFRQLERAAIESQTRPAQKAPKAPKPVRVRQPGDPKPHGRRQDVKVVPCVTCGHPTRGAKIPADRAPGTRPRRAGGTCTTCPNPRKAAPKQHQPKVATDVLAADYHAGMSLQDVATKHGISKTTVLKQFNQAKIARRPVGVNLAHTNTDDAATKTVPLPVIRPCAGGCGRITRPRTQKHSGAGGVPRIRDGKCSTCITGGRIYHTKPVDVEALVADYVAGMSLSQVRKKYGVAKDTASRHIRNAGIELRPAPANLRRA
jgi:transposase